MATTSDFQPAVPRALAANAWRIGNVAGKHDGERLANVFDGPATLKAMGARLSDTLVLAAAISAGCKQLPPGVLAEDATLITVSEAQDFVLYSNSDSDLKVVFPASRDSRTLVPNFQGYVSVYGSTVLGDLGGGYAGIWTPRMDSPWLLPHPVENLGLSADGKTLAYFHSPDPTAFPLRGDVELVRVDGCGSDSCTRSSILTNVGLSVPILSDDSRFLAVDGEKLMLFDLSSSTSTSLELPAGYGPTSPVFSHDGSLLALSPYHFQPSWSTVLQVYSTETASLLPWPVLPPGLPFGGPNFLGDNSVLQTMQPDQQSWFSVLVTSTAVTQVASGTGSSPNAGPVGDRYIVGPGTMPDTFSVTDLRAPNNGPFSVSLGSNVYVGAFSDDGAEVVYFENYDSNSRIGDLVLATFPAAERQASISNVWAFLYADVLGWTVQFVEGDNASLLYLSGGDPREGGRPLHLWRHGTDRLIADGVTAFLSRQHPDTVYFDTKSPDGTSSIHRAALE